MQLKLLITEHFLTTLAAGHAFLLGLTGLRRRKLLLLLLFDNVFRSRVVTNVREWVVTGQVLNTHTLFVNVLRLVRRKVGEKVGCGALATEASGVHVTQPKQAPLVWVATTFAYGAAR